MRVVVTGSAGLIGTRLVNNLRAKGHQAIAVDLRSSGSATGDFRALQSLELINRSIDGIVHLAAVSRVAWGEADPRLCREINVDGTDELLRRTLQQAPHAWFLFASSREVYGDPETILVSESDALKPVNHYGRSKLEGETAVAYARDAGLAMVTLRLCNVYGGREDHPDRAVPALAQRAVNGEILHLTGGDGYFDFVHVDDVVEGIMCAIHLLTAGEENLPTLHLATGNATTLRSLAEMAIDAAKSRSRINEIKPRDFDVSGFCGAPEMAEKVLGWRAGIDIENGIAQFVADLRINGPLDPFLLKDLQG